MSPLVASQRALLAPGWVGYPNALWRRARAVPSLDLRFAENKSLVDATTGTNLVTFARASSGTYVGSDGLIKTATTNLRTFSEDFTNAVYSVSTRLTITADALAAPNGTITADKLVAAINNDQKFVETTGSVVTGFAYVFGMYAKKAEYEVLQISVANTNFSGTLAYANFNLSTGSVISSADCTPNIKAIGDGWYRCSVIMPPATGTGANAFRFAPYASGNPGRLASYTGDGTSGIYLWGAQLEQSSTVGEYIPTTSTINSAPRFDHNPTTGESLGLLVEEQRTNLAINSALTGGTTPTSWTLAGTPDTPTVVASILGNADGATALSFTSNSSRGYIQQTVALAANTTYTFSVYVENTAGYASTSANIISLNDGPTGSTITGATGNPVSGQRIICSISVGATAGNVQLRIGLGVGSNGTGTIVLSRPQLEAGGFPTSYIPTTTATVTRAADVASITGSNFSSWYRQDEGTVFGEFSAAAYSTASLSISDGTNSNRIMIDRGSTGTRYVITNAGVAQSGGAQTLYVLNSFARSAIGFALDNCNLAVNGATQAVDTSASIPSSVDRLLLGVNANGSGYGNGPIKRIAFWRSRLSDSTLASITQ